MDVKDVIGLFTGWLTRIQRLAKTMVDLHLDLASKEADKERARLVRGIMLLLVAGALATLALMLLQFALVSLVHDQGLSWPQALLAVGVGDLVLAGMLTAGAMTALKGPWMDETRARVAKSAATLKGDSES